MRVNEMTRQDREDLRETLAAAAVGAFLGFMAFRSFWHAGLFGFLAYGISAVGNRVVWELQRARIDLHRES
ncbi:hypothetical protein BQ8482_330210 [Mesorhizobium delmotii]|uniref:Uncharacterized protein n=1 Tax=Mesorhizobium delmotii TaxID=1631247 RepID=A0A2P9APK1_9HYPH|nr:hypothetical protein BQ8482_330210 [Mesorhizobium delmotii]